jgi:hypothetical protein
MRREPGTGVYSGIWTPLGHGVVPCIESFQWEIWGHRLNTDTEVSLIQGCTLRGVPAYMSGGCTTSHMISNLCERCVTTKSSNISADFCKITDHLQIVM